MSCRTACISKDHKTFGACARASRIQLGDVKGAGQARALDLRLSTYDTARRQGIQPESTKLRDSQRAIAISEKAGRAFDANPR